MKKLSVIILLTFTYCLLVGCQDKTSMKELQKLKTQVALEEQNKDLIKNYFEELNKGNIELYNELLASDYKYYFPSNNSDPMNPKAVDDFLSMIFQAFPDINWEIQEIFAKGDRVVIRLIITGTHEGEFQGMPATGNKFEFSSILIYLIKDGKIIEEREEADILGLMQQLGMELKPKGK